MTKPRIFHIALGSNKGDKFKNLQNDLTYCKSDILMFNQIVFC